MKAQITINTQREIKITEGDRWIIFNFNDGDMINTRQSMPFHKTREDWEFYGKAIKMMIKKTAYFYKNKKKLPIIIHFKKAFEIPF